MKHSGWVVKLFSQEKVYDNLSGQRIGVLAANARQSGGKRGREAPLGLCTGGDGGRRWLEWQGSDSNPRLQVMVRVHQGVAPGGTATVSETVSNSTSR